MGLLLAAEDQRDSKEMSTLCKSDLEAYSFWDNVQKSSSLLSRCQECLEFCRRRFLFRFVSIKCPRVVNQAHPCADAVLRGEGSLAPSSPEVGDKALDKRTD